MKITELLDLKGIELNVSVSSKDEAINKLFEAILENIQKECKAPQPR